MFHIIILVVSDCHFMGDVMESDFWAFQWVTETSSDAKDPITANHRRGETMKGKIGPSVFCSCSPGIYQLTQLCYLLNMQKFLEVWNIRHWISETFRKFRKWACSPFFTLHFQTNLFSVPIFLLCFIQYLQHVTLSLSFLLCSNVTGENIAPNIKINK